jgi:hypothetical protein
MNNPLMYTDLNGEAWWHWLIGDLLTGGALSTTAITTGGLMLFDPITTFTSFGVTAMAGIPTLSAVDFTSIFLQGFSDPAQAGKRFKNWLDIEFEMINFVFGAFRYDELASGVEWPLQVIHNLTGGELLQDYVGNALAHYLNISKKIDATGYYQGRLIIRTEENTINAGISLGHYVFGDDIALNPSDVKHNTDLFAHEFGHTYQSRITGPLYLFRYGLASAIYGRDSKTEDDANIRAARNNLPISNWRTQMESNYKWYEFLGAPILWPFMWTWSH